MKSTSCTVGRFHYFHNNLHRPIHNHSCCFRHHRSRHLGMMGSGMENHIHQKHNFHPSIGNQSRMHSCSRCRSNHRHPNHIRSCCSHHHRNRHRSMQRFHSLRNNHHWQTPDQHTNNHCSRNIGLLVLTNHSNRHRPMSNHKCYSHHHK